MNKIRLYIEIALNDGAELTLPESQSHYLRNVMRLKVGDKIFVFNGINGEWEASIIEIGKKAIIVRLIAQTLPHEITPDIWLLFAPIKAGRIEFLVEKATELGATRLIPVKTERTIISRVNETRLRAHAIEAAEQSGRIDVPTIMPYQSLAQTLNDWDSSRTLIYGDESGAGLPANQLLPTINLPIALLIGPEGGFSPNEFAQFKQHRFMHPLDMGKRIMRAETAALAGLTLLQNYCN